MAEGQGGKPNIVKMTENWDSTSGELETADKASTMGADHGHSDSGGGGSHGGSTRLKSAGKKSAPAKVVAKKKPARGR